jgi:hypothetical protein
LGYTQDDVEKRVVNLAEGENFAPAFLKIVSFHPTEILTAHLSTRILKGHYQPLKPEERHTPVLLR